MNVNNCETCLNYRNSSEKDSMMKSQIPYNPLEMVGTDVMTVKGKYYFVMIDSFPKCIEAASVEKLDSKTTVDRLKSIFTWYT